MQGLWSSLVAAQGGGSVSGSTGEEEQEDEDDMSSDEGSAEPSWAPANWATGGRRLGRLARSTPQSAKQLSSAKIEWDTIRGAHGRGGVGSCRHVDGTGRQPADSWCELTICTGNSHSSGALGAETGRSTGSADYLAMEEQPNVEWRQLRAQSGSINS